MDHGLFLNAGSQHLSIDTAEDGGLELYTAGEYVTLNYSLIKGLYEYLELYLAEHEPEGGE